MCMGSKVQTPSSAPPPPAVRPQAPIIANPEEAALAAASAGKGKLKIDLGVSTPDDGSGLKTE